MNKKQKALAVLLSLLIIFTIKIHQSAAIVAPVSLKEVPVLTSAEKPTEAMLEFSEENAHPLLIAETGFSCLLAASYLVKVRK